MLTPRRGTPSGRAVGVRSVVIGVVVITAVVAAAGVAVASFSTNTSVATTVSTGQLVAPTGLAAAHGSCSALSSDSVNLGWTATASTIADGYEIFRGTVSGGPYSSIGTVSGRTTTAYTDSGRPFMTTYYYVVQTKRNNWRSENSGQASITTRTLLCV